MPEEQMNRTVIRRANSGPDLGNVDYLIVEGNFAFLADQDSRMTPYTFSSLAVYGGETDRTISFDQEGKAVLRPGQCLVIQGGELKPQDQVISDLGKTPVRLTVVELAPEKNWEKTAMVHYHPEEVPPEPSVGGIVAAAAGGLLLGAAAAAGICTWIARRSRRGQTQPAVKPVSLRQLPGDGVKVTAASMQHVGKREDQQDSFGVCDVENGILAVMADGMGGLRDGGRVSKALVDSFLKGAAEIPANEREYFLYKLLERGNREVNEMLGPDGVFNSGSTLVAVLLEESAGAWRFQWLSVGDSRIYLYRGGSLLQINTEHIYLRDLLLQGVRGDISFPEAFANASRGSLVSFVGMGELKYADGSIRPVELREKDTLLLLSDGVFNSVSEHVICAVLDSSPDVQEAAKRLEAEVHAAGNPHQDNFTAVILRMDSDKT